MRAWQEVSGRRWGGTGESEEFSGIIQNELGSLLSNNKRRNPTWGEAGPLEYRHYEWMMSTAVWVLTSEQWSHPPPHTPTRKPCRGHIWPNLLPTWGAGRKQWWPVHTPVPPPKWYSRYHTSLHLTADFFGLAVSLTCLRHSTTAAIRCTCFLPCYCGWPHPPGRWQHMQCAAAAPSSWGTGKWHRLQTRRTEVWQIGTNHTEWRRLSFPWTPPSHQAPSQNPNGFNAK